MKRLGLIGDVHAEDQRLATALDWLGKEQVDAVLCVGDLADGEGDLERCIALLDERKVITVAGNHDRWLLASAMRELEHTHKVETLSDRAQDFLNGLPPTRRIETVAGPLHLCHGLGRVDMRFIQDVRSLAFELEGGGYTRNESMDLLGIDRDTRVIVGGHTHLRWADDLGELTMVNPGTLKRTDAPGFALLELDKVGWQVRFLDLADPHEAVPADGGTIAP